MKLPPKNSSESTYTRPPKNKSLRSASCILVKIECFTFRFSWMALKAKRTYPTVLTPITKNVTAETQKITGSLLHNLNLNLLLFTSRSALEIRTGKEKFSCLRNKPQVRNFANLHSPNTRQNGKQAGDQNRMKSSTCSKLVA